MKPFKTYAYIYSLNKGKFDSTELDEVEILEVKRTILEDNDKEQWNIIVS